MSTTKIGRNAEAAAERYLKRRGFQPLFKNYRSGHHEIDLVMRDGDYLVFIEVKARKSDRYGSPAEAVTPEKQRRLIAAAQGFLLRENCPDSAVRFDVVEVDLASGSVRHIPDAFCT